MAAKPPFEQDRTIGLLKDAGVSVICCPSAALSMKQLDMTGPLHNSIAPVPKLLEAGVPVTLVSSRDQVLPGEDIIYASPGGTANGGDDTGPVHTFTITVTNTNDAPTVANPIPDRTATEDAAFAYQFPSNTFADLERTSAYAHLLATIMSELPNVALYRPDAQGNGRCVPFFLVVDAGRGMGSETSVSTASARPGCFVTTASVEYDAAPVEDEPVAVLLADDEELPEALATHEPAEEPVCRHGDAADTPWAERRATLLALSIDPAAREVTGSCHILRVNGSTILLDCGIGGQRCFGSQAAREDRRIAAAAGKRERLAAPIRRSARSPPLASASTTGGCGWAAWRSPRSRSTNSDPRLVTRRLPAMPLLETITGPR